MRTRCAGLLVLALTTLLVLPASAAELPFWLHGSLGYGKIIEDNAPDGSVGFEVGIIYPLEGMPISVGADLGYLVLGSVTSSETDPYTGASFNAEAKWSAVPITGQVYFTIPASERTTFYLDSGLGLYHLRWKIEGQAEYMGMGISASSSDSETDFGFNGGFGFRFGNPSSQLSFGLDTKFHLILTEGESTEVMTVMGRVFFR